uniref:Hyaluronan/mRNA-binding protein domain-containing protein n=1 Tax=Paramormyrops kingsleyae TaxID=1676925 RepID=A0A3B3TFN4_9TELE|nr:intracellular hyaluronan-binding protein 4-like [Paramormyrops kingsleyae]
MNGVKSGSVMEQDAFGCTVMNRFDHLLDDDADPFDILREAQQEKEKKKEELKRGSEGKPGKKGSQKDRKTPSFWKGNAAPVTDATGNRFSYGRQIQNENRGVVEVERGERRPVFREQRFNVMEPLQERVFDKPVDDKFERGNWDRARAQMAYPRYTDGFDQRGKRQFERQSGSMQSGVRPDEKREGGGPRNWGSMKDPVRGFGVELTPPEEAGDVDESPGAAEMSAESQAAEEGECIPDVVMEMSLDEWKALQEQYRPKVELNLRKPESKVPKKAVVIHKSKYYQGKEPLLEADEDLYSLRRPANDITSTLDINFGSLTRPSRGGRGGRGGRGRGNSAVPPETLQYDARVLAPNPDDMEDFPALA